jgi:4-oxalocrotonate tautomerase
MPFVRIEMRRGRSIEERRAISDAIHLAMVETINVPALDKFQVITEHDASQFIYDASYLDIARTDALVIIQITLNTGRTVEMKKALYARIAAKLQQIGIRPQDVLINLVEVPKENWSFGNGEAQYAPK